MTNSFNPSLYLGDYYQFTTITYPGDTFTQALGINNAGEIVGFHGQTTNQAYSLTLPASFTPLVIPGATMSQAVGINSSGQIVGFYVDAGGVTHGYILKNGAVTTQDEAGTKFNQLLGLNDTGEYAGYSSLDPTGATLQLAYTYSAITNQYTQLDDAAHNLALPTNVNSQATSVDNAGDVVGFYMPTSSTSDGFLLTPGSKTAVSLSFPGSTFTQALGINNKGQIAGFYMDSKGVSHGFILSNGIWTSVDAPGATSTTINGINDAGQIAGFDTTSSGATQGFEVNVPVAAMSDSSSGANWQQAMVPYSGPVQGLTNEFVTATSDTINITPQSPNFFVQIGGATGPNPTLAGINASVANGNNVLDSYANSTFLTDGSGVDQNYLDTRYLTANQWDTIVNFHSGDNVTLWGVSPSDFTLDWIGIQGSSNATGLTGVFVPTSGKGPDVAFTLAGYTAADQTNGKLSVSYNTIGGVAYASVHAT
ncbi:MAG TPA: hypothetical protein VHO91_05385 [Rhodopila sp.]|nr:hypothetical protein [Rhodopila sp.]